MEQSMDEKIQIVEKHEALMRKIISGGQQDSRKVFTRSTNPLEYDDLLQTGVQYFKFFNTLYLSVTNTYSGIKSTIMYNPTEEDLKTLDDYKELENLSSKEYLFTISKGKLGTNPNEPERTFTEPKFDPQTTAAKDPRGDFKVALTGKDSLLGMLRTEVDSKEPEVTFVLPENTNPTGFFMEGDTPAGVFKPVTPSVAQHTKMIQDGEKCYKALFEKWREQLGYLKGEDKLKGENKKQLQKINVKMEDLRKVISQLEVLQEYQDTYVSFLKNHYPYIPINKDKNRKIFSPQEIDNIAALAMYVNTNKVLERAVDKKFLETQEVRKTGVYNSDFNNVNGFYTNVEQQVNTWDSMPENKPLTLLHSTIEPAVDKFKQMMNDLGSIFSEKVSSWGSSHVAMTLVTRLTTLREEHRNLIKEKQALLDKLVKVKPSKSKTKGS